jgi:methionine synthase II (cobalamin-independent)
LLLYPREVKEFLGRGGKLAFGIVPTSPEGIRAETPETLADRMDAIFGKFEARGIGREDVARAALITPACGLGTLTEAEAERALLLTCELSHLLRRRYPGASG